MIKKSAKVTVIFIVNAVTQLFSQIVITRLFGAKIDLDIFLAAVAVPTVAVSTIYSTLNDAFLPLYGEIKVKNRTRARSYFASHLITLTLLFLLIALVMNFLSHPISQLLYSNRGTDFVRAVTFQMSYLFYSLPLAIVATLLGTHYYSEKKFYRFPLAQLVGNLTNLLMVILLQPLIGIWSLVFAFVTNIFFQILVILPYAGRETRPLHHLSLIINSLTLKPFNSLTLKPFNSLTLFLSWFPLIVAYSTFRSETVFVRSLASSLSSGYMVYLNLIMKMFTLTTGVMTIGIQILLLPHLVEYFTQKYQYQKAIQMIKKAKITALGVSLLVSLAVWLTAPFLIDLLFVGGKFSRHDAMIANSLLPLFVIPAVGWGSYGVFFQPLLALKKQVPLAIICILSCGLGWLVATAAKSIFGPLPAIRFGLIVWLGFGIIGTEILWQIYKKKHLTFQPPPLSFPPSNAPDLP